MDPLDLDAIEAAIVANARERYDPVYGLSTALVAELRTARAERDALAFQIECADTPLMRAVMAERDVLAARNEALERSRNSARLSIKRVLAYEVHLSDEGARSLIDADSALSGATEPAGDESENRDPETTP